MKRYESSSPHMDRAGHDAARNLDVCNLKRSRGNVFLSRHCGIGLSAGTYEPSLERESQSICLSRHMTYPDRFRINEWAQQGQEFCVWAALEPVAGEPAGDSRDEVGQLYPSITT
jgi:hypothetical protein